MKNYLKYLVEFPDKTCIVIEGETIIFSSEANGVKPLLDFYKLYQRSKNNLIVIDKIMGRSAVLLAKLINATSIYTPIISKDALELAEEYGMNHYFEAIVPYIINRTKDGRCPIEASVLDISDVYEGHKVILETISKLMRNK